MSLVTGNKGLHFATSINNSGLQQGVVSAQGILRGFAIRVLNWLTLIFYSAILSAFL